MISFLVLRGELFIQSTQHHSMIDGKCVLHFSLVFSTNSVKLCGAPNFSIIFHPLLFFRACFAHQFHFMNNVWKKIQLHFLTRRLSLLSGSSYQQHIVKRTSETFFLARWADTEMDINISIFFPSSSSLQAGLAQHMIQFLADDLLRLCLRGDWIKKFFFRSDQVKRLQTWNGKFNELNTQADHRLITRDVVWFWCCHGKSTTDLRLFFYFQRRRFFSLMNARQSREICFAFSRLF